MALADGGAMAAGKEAAEAALAEYLAGQGLVEWFGPLRVAIEAALRGEPDEAEFTGRLRRLTSNLGELFESMDTATFEDALSRTIYSAAAEGKATRAADLARKG